MSDSMTLWLMNPGSGGELSAFESLVRRPPWMEQGACRGQSTATYFPTQGGDVTVAKAQCRACPVRQDCLDHALADPELVGIWGGTSARERAQMRRSVA